MNGLRKDHLPCPPLRTPVSLLQETPIDTASKDFNATSLAGLEQRVSLPLS